MQLLGVLLVVSLAQLATSVAVAEVVSDLFHRLQTGREASANLSWLLVAAMAATLAGELARRLLTETLGLDYAADLRLALFERLLRRPLHSGPQRSRGSLLLPFVGDLTALRQWWSDGVARGSSSAVIAAGIVGWMAWIAPLLALWCGLLAVVALALIWAIAGPMFRATSRQRAARGVLTALLSDRIEAAHAIMATGSVQRELGRMRGRIGRMTKAALWRAGWSGLMRGVLAAFPLAAVLVVAGAAAPGGDGLATHEVAGMLALSGMLGSALADLGRAVELAIPAHIARSRLTARFDEVQPLQTGAGGAPVRGAPLLQLDGLRLSSRAKAFSIALRKGEVVSLEGRHAALLAGMLAGLEVPVAGTVRIAGHCAAGLSQRQRRQWLGVAAPWAPLLQDDLAHNLLQRMRRGAGESELPALLRQLDLGHLLDDAERIAPRRLRDDGAGLARHERVAVRLVRALIGRPRLLILQAASIGLNPRQIIALQDQVRRWPGIVVLAEECPELVQLATRRFNVASSITEIAINAGDQDQVAAILSLRPAGRV